MLSAAIESAAGQPFLSYVEGAVLAPLQMTSTTPDRWEVIVRGRAAGYEKDQAGQLTNAPWVDNSNKWAGGGFLSTCEDLVRFGLAHVAPGLFKAETLALLFTSQRTASGEPTNVGLAWRIASDANALTYVHHGGDSAGARAFLLVVPQSRAVVALLANLARAPFAEKEALELLAVFDQKVAR